MRKASPKSGAGSKTDKAFGETRGTRLTATGGKIITWRPLPMYKGPQGSLIFPMQFQVLQQTVSSDSSGEISLVLPLNSNIWSQIAIEATRFKRMRLRAAAFELLPKVGFNTNGTAIQYWNYSGDATAPVAGSAGMTAASKIEQNIPDIVPFKAHLFQWRLQDNKDVEFITAASAVLFNSTGHYFKLKGTGFPASNAIWDLYAYAIVDFTENFA